MRPSGDAVKEEVGRGSVKPQGGWRQGLSALTRSSLQLLEAVRRRPFTPSTSPLLSPPSPVVVALLPVRPLFLSFLTDEDVGRLLPLSRTTTLSLFKGYTFHRHVFELAEQTQLWWRVKALCESYQLRVTRMHFPHKLNKVRLERWTHRSPLPSSLTSLLMGPLRSTVGDPVQNSLFGSEAARCESIQSLWSLPLAESEEAHYRQLLMAREELPVWRFTRTYGSFESPIPPGLLPHGLRRLQLPNDMTAFPLVGTIPSTVEVLQFGTLTEPTVTVPLSVGVLPSSLVHLVLNFNTPLYPGVLPPSLQRLAMWWWDQPLAVGVLPASLRALEMPHFNHPLSVGALPSGLTHLLLFFFDHPLTGGSLPPSLVSFELGQSFRYPLHPGVLPSSLRVLFHRNCTPHPLQPGSLPEGLVVLHWLMYSDSRAQLLPGVLPSSLRVVDLGSLYEAPIKAGVIPPTVAWLRLSVKYAQAERLAELHLSKKTQVVWDDDDDWYTLYSRYWSYWGWE